MRFPLVLLVSGLLTSGVNAQETDPGLLLMAHGGSPEWNAHVRRAIEPLQQEMPVAVAFGMANPMTLAAAVDSLEALGVDEILVVRLFLSGDSFLEETGYILGLHDRRPKGGMHAEHMHALALDAPVRVSREGLLDASEVGGIVRERALALSRNPAAESVLLIAHGAASDEENDAWLRRMDAHADSIREAAPFAAVRAETLREDWDEPRAIAEVRIRSFVEAEAAAGRDVIVVPFRLAGFGPYAEVLDGLPYTSDGRGLLPDVRITDWIRRQVLELAGAETGLTNPVP